MMEETSSMGLTADDLQGFADRIAKILGGPDPDCPCNLTDLYHMAKDRLRAAGTGVTDSEYNLLRLGDEVDLFGMVGEVVFECGSYGIGFREVIDWERITSRIKPETGCDNRPDFCFNDNFISFWELLWNFNCDDGCCHVVTRRPA